MSISRGNWSNLSRLAQQWIEDDEEEQIRERRRRNRETSTSSKVEEVVTETDSSSSQPISSAASPKENTKLLNKGQLENLQDQEKAKIPKKHKEDHKLPSTKLEAVERKISAPETQEVQQTKSTAQDKQNVTSRKEEPQNHTNTSKQEEPQNHTNTSKQEEPQNHTNTSKQEEPQNHTNTSKKVEPQSQTNTSKQEESQNHTNTSKKEETQNHTNTSKKEEPQKNTNTSKKEELQNHTTTSKPENPQNHINTSKQEEPQNHTKASNKILNKKEITTSNSHKESISSKTPQCLEPKGVKGTLQSNVMRLQQKFSNVTETDNIVKVQKAQPQQTSSQINNSVEEEKTKVPVSKAEDHPIQARNTSATVSDPVSAAPSEPQNDTNTLSNHGSQSKYKTQVYVSSVKIPRRTSSSCSIKSPVPEAIEEEPFAETKSVKSEVFISPVSSSNLNSKQNSLPSSQQTSTSFVRLGPLSSSVRVKSQSQSEDDKDDSGFTRRSSLRLSLRSRKLDDRVEKYTSAIQRSSSFRQLSSRGAIGASDAVANKRSIFEKNEENSATANASRKDLTLSGSVTARINQWSNKGQESTNTVAGTKDFKSGDVASKRMLWQQRSQTSNDTKL